MFGIIEEILQKFKKKIGTKKDYKIINLSGNQVFVQGHRNIQKFSESAVILTIKNGSIFVHGEKLCIEELQSNTIYISGLIEKVEVN